MKRIVHGTREKRGRQADRATPASKGGADALENMRPLRRENGQKKLDGTLRR